MPTRRLLLTLLAAAAASACTSPPGLAAGSLVDVQIVDRRRSERSRPGATAARATSPAARAIATRCASPTVRRGRVLVVLSVDGVNAVSGETAASAQTGYVLGALSIGRDHRLAKELFRSSGVLLHRPARLLRGAHRPARQRRRDRRRGLPRAGCPSRSRGWFEPAPSVAKEANAGGRLEAERQRSGAAADAAAPAAQSAARCAAPTRSRRATRRSSAPATASASIRRPARPRSSGPARSPAEVVQIRYDSYANLRGERRHSAAAAEAAPARCVPGVRPRSELRAAATGRAGRRAPRSACQTRSGVSGIWMRSAARPGRRGRAHRPPRSPPPASRRWCRVRPRP